MGERDSLSILLNLRTLSVDKLDENTNRNTPVTFRVNVKFDETSRKVEETTVDFGITVTTEPNVARFGVEGLAVVRGKAEDIERVFATPPDSKVPNLLFEIYDRLYTAVYVTSSILDVPCPSPLLLRSGVQSEQPVEESRSEAPVTEKGAAGVAGMKVGVTGASGAASSESATPQESR
ncbi:MAG: hypothetical protein M1503_09025 [Thaumarchaeota archaeon]|nr:hypothetical protein [Nitrososphaerota archaeon]MCL5318379.1 hypothetical protein [Nitrososphaerota archaeon]